jgi:hypothetical protein
MCLFRFLSVDWTRGALSLNSTLPLITERIYDRKVIALLLFWGCSFFGGRHSDFLILNAVPNVIHLGEIDVT